MRLASVALLGVALGFGATAGCSNDGLLADNNPSNRIDSGFFRIDSGADVGPRPDARPIEVPDANVTPDAEPLARCDCPTLPTSCPALTPNVPAFSPGGALTQQIVDMIACSGDYLHIGMYETDWDCIVSALVDKLAADTDLRVEIVIDDDQCPLDSGGTRLCALGRLHGHPRVAIVDDARTRYMHHKFMIADGRTMWIGSANFTRVSFCTELNDGIIIDDPSVISGFEAEFSRLHVRREFGPRPSDGPLTSGRYSVYFGPVTPISAPSPWFDDMIGAIDTASTSIAVMTAAWTRTEISAALLRASGRGVSVKALVPIQYQDEPPAQALVAAHLPVRLAKVHHKLLIIDRQLVITGSPNWSENSWANNEASVWIRDPMIAAAYASRFDAAFAAGADPPP